MKMKKTELMIEVEERIGEPIDDFIKRRYLEDKISVVKIAGEIKTSVSVVRNWIKNFGIKQIPIKEVLLWRKGVVKPSKEGLEKMYFRENVSTYDIATKLGISHSTVRNWMDDYGIQFRKKKLNISEGELIKLVIDEGKNIPYIAKYFGVDYSTIRKKIDEYKLPRRKRAQKLNKPSDEELKRLLEKYKNRKEIAEELGVSPSTVNNWYWRSSIYNRKKRIHYTPKFENFDEWKDYGLDRSYQTTNPKNLEKSDDPEKRSWYRRGNKNKWLKNFPFEWKVPPWENKKKQLENLLESYVNGK
jgi:transposase-like protein